MDEIISDSDLCTVKDFTWTDDYGFHRWLTCVNHPKARFSTKNPYGRSVHNQNDEARACQCGIEDLRVIMPWSVEPRKQVHVLASDWGTAHERSFGRRETTLHVTKVTLKPSGGFDVEYHPEHHGKTFEDIDESTAYCVEHGLLKVYS